MAADAASPSVVPQAPPPDASRRAPLSVSQWLGASMGVLLALAIAGVGAGLVVNERLSERRHVVLDQLEPALQAGLRLENALINEETGVRGYVLTGETAFLAPYEAGLHAEAHAYEELRAQARVAPSRLGEELETVLTRASAWRNQFVVPALRRPHKTARELAVSSRGKSHFDRVRTALASLQSDLMRRLATGHSQLEGEAQLLTVVLIAAGALILASVLAAALVLRASITRPLARLGAEARRVAAGEFERQPPKASGAREIVDLAGEIEVMRGRILGELSKLRAASARLEEQALDLRRSNSELEQFAYVASHDLQEPLRKVASFCQALQQRYAGQLDERADQYIEFAVDGARRMQVLINDLLEFSRVGRGSVAREPVDLREVLAEVTRSLSGPLREAGATIVGDELPVVRGERSLLVSLLQNLIGNSVKFRGAEAPVIRFSAVRDGNMWQIGCADNGIGVEPQYAERIFVIFQRLHTKETYGGTGIGLALCRKIVEYHGGRIWLDSDHRGGTCIRFTLPPAQTGADE